MSKRRMLDEERGKLFGGKKSGESSLERATRELWNSGDDRSDTLERVARTRKERIANVDIFEVQPDLTQPRRAIPASIRGAWRPNAADMGGFIEHWAQQARINLPALLDADGEVDIPDSIPPVTAALLRVVELARSIKAQGLVNPISVVVLDDDGYQIETGERRWLAYHVLFGVYGNGWQKIPARVRDTFDPFRQAAENNQRSDLNAISRARQYALLMMALHPDDDWQPYDAFGSDRAYYAQALRYDRAPQGKGALLVNALGVKDRSIVTYCRRMLDMPDDLWQQADDENWTQDRILQVVGNSNKSTPRASKPSWVEAVRQDIARIYTKALKKSKRASDEEVEDAIQAFEQAAAELREQLNRRR